MKRILGITFGGLQKRAILLMLATLLSAVAVFSSVTYYQNRMLIKLVEETRREQQQAISDVSGETMYQMVAGSLVRSTALQSRIADNDFAEVVDNVRMLRTMTQGIFESRGRIPPAAVSLPDPARAGEPSAMALFEEGVDYERSEYLGLAANLTAPMLALLQNSDKIDGVFIGLADGTDLCVDECADSKLDEAGRVIPFPVRERPWYTGAVEAGDVYFTGVGPDTFTGRSLITCSAPVYAEGEFVGVVGIDIRLKSMRDFVSASAGNGSSVCVVNSSGQVVLASAGGLFSPGTAGEAQDLRSAENEALAKFVEQSLRGNTDLAVITVGGSEYYMAGAPMPTVGWAVLSAVDKQLTEQPERQLLAEYDRINAEASETFETGMNATGRLAVLIIAGLFLAGLAAALYATRRMVRPIEEMTRSVAESSRTGRPFEMKPAYRTNDEIELLAEAFDDLSRKTRKYIEDITAITAEKERISTELSLAREIQAGMLPHIFPPFPDRSELDIYASMDPAKEVGGDFYDFFLIDDDHLCLVVADVSGKGVPAALFMMASKIILSSCAMLGNSAAEILTRTNEAICSNNQQEMFVTVWVGILEISTGRLTAANAGHEYPVLLHGGRFALLRDRHGLVIGGMEGVRYREYELQLHPGDKLFLYTDGVPEATDSKSEMFGLERMLDALNRAPEASPQTILKNVRAAVDGFVKDAEQFDDLTMLCLEYRGPGGAEAASPDSASV